VRRLQSPLAQFVSALGTRWSQERCREQRREDSRQRTNAALRRTSRSFRPSRRPADDEIRRNLTIFNLINDAAGDLITIHDPKGLCLYASEASMTMLGLSPDDLIGSNHFDFIHEKDQSLLRQALEAMIDHGISQCIEVRVREAGGAWRWVEARTGSVRNDEGRFCEIITVMRDISARREYEQALSFNEQNLRAILDNIGDAAWLKDATGRYLMVNPAFAQLFAREADEFVGLTESDVFDPRVAHTSLEYDQLVMLTGNQLSYTLRMPMTELEERHLEIHKGPVSDDEGTIIGITGTARDVTQRMTEHLDLARAAVLLSSVEGIAPVGVWSLCCPELGMAWSDSLYRIMGCETGAFSPTLNTVMRLVVPEDRAGLRRVIREAVGERRQFEARFRLQGDGCAIEAHTRGAGFFDAGGRLCEIAGVVYLAENQRGLGTQAQQAGQAG
jgi:PAS domain S-box-containing protein